MLNENSSIFNCNDLSIVTKQELPKQQALCEMYKLLSDFEHLQEYCLNNNIPFNDQIIEELKRNLLILPLGE